MPRYAWTTDCHLDHLASDQVLIDFGQKIVEQDPPGVFITGDISNAMHVVYHLSALEKIVQRPIFFVLGNHDYYQGEIETVRKSMKDVSNMSQFLRYLPTTSYIALTPGTALVGHDGWYDAFHGDAKNSNFLLNDWALTKDFIENSGGSQYMNATRNVKNRDLLISQFRKLAHDGVLHVQNGIKSAARYHKNIIVLTHYPPFAESHLYKGQPGDANALPWFTSKMMGDMLMDASKAYPSHTFTVLAGHTHGKYEGKPTSNLRVMVGGAEYGRPDIAGMVEVP